MTDWKRSWREGERGGGRERRRERGKGGSEGEERGRKGEKERREGREGEERLMHMRRGRGIMMSYCVVLITFINVIVSHTYTCTCVSAHEKLA